jgi:steroid delta-isomerase-like uncharacterized protein
MTIVSATGTNERLIMDWARLLSAHELDGLVQLFTDDVIYEDVTLGVVNRGKEALRTFAARFITVFPDVTLELSLTFATATRGGAEWVMRGTHSVDLPEVRARGKCMELRGASILEFAEGKIQRVSDYWDRSALLEQLR